MVCENSIVFRLSGTVIRKIWLRVLLVGIYTTALVCEDKYYAILKIRFPETLIPVLGAVTGLLLIFRTNTAYERYWEGRKLWSQITHNVRTLIRFIWTTVEENEVEDLIEKVTIINLLVAFPFAVKNYLRGNYSYEAEDLKDLIAHLPRLIPSKFGPGNASDGTNSAVPKRLDSDHQISNRVSGSKVNIKRASNSDASNSAVPKPVDLEPQISSRVNGSKVDVKRTSNSEGGNSAGPKPLNLDHQMSSMTAGRKTNMKKASKRDKQRAHAQPTETHIPSEILLYFASYMKKLATMEKRMHNTFIDAMEGSVSACSDAVSGLERILQTPIALAYAVHLEHTVWLFVLALPFQLIAALSWWAIAGVTLAAFALLGILDIGTEIENPFETDFNDLPLQQICERIKQEAFLIVGRSLAVDNPATWIFNEKNIPVLDLKRQGSLDLSKKNVEEVRQQGALDLSKKNLEEVRQMLAKRADAFSTFT